MLLSPSGSLTTTPRTLAEAVEERASGLAHSWIAQYHAEESASHAIRFNEERIRKLKGTLEEHRQKVLFHQDQVRYYELQMSNVRSDLERLERENLFLQRERNSEYSRKLASLENRASTNISVGEEDFQPSSPRGAPSPRLSPTAERQRLMLAELEHKVENRLVDDEEMYEEEKKRIEARAEELRSIEADLERKKRVAFEEDRKAVLSYGSGSHLSPSIRNSHLRNRSSIDSISIFDLPPSPRTPLGSQYSSAEKKSEDFSPNVSPLHDRTGSGPRVRSSSPRQRRVRFDNTFESASLNDASSPSMSRLRSSIPRIRSPASARHAWDF